MDLRKRVGRLVAAGALLAGSLVGVSASGASAGEAGAEAFCNTIDQVRNSSSGFGYFLGTVPVHTHPYGACAATNYRSGTKFYYWCYRYNDYGNFWIFGRVAGSEFIGWVYSPNVTWETGSLNSCDPS